MNRTERLYADHLQLLKLAGEIDDFRFEAISIRLGHDCFYRPDFLVVLKDGTQEIHEVKGFMRDDARAKLAICASLCPWWPVFVIRRVDGQWEIERLKTVPLQAPATSN